MFNEQMKVKEIENEFKKITLENGIEIKQLSLKDEKLFIDFIDNSKRIGLEKLALIEELLNKNINNGIVKLTNLSGVYLDGDSSKQMISRISGVLFNNEKELRIYNKKIEEAEKRDHRKIGKDLFFVAEEGPGLPFFLPNGVIIRNELENFWRKIHIKNNYQEIKTPIILNQELWKQSGHYAHYKDNMYETKVDDRTFAIKPMNCPGAVLTYKNSLHSYSELPIRYNELGLVHRHENSGNLHGLMRVRSFTQDDAHVFLTTEQIETELVNIIEMIHGLYKKFGFTYNVELSTRPKDSMGTNEQWTAATDGLEKALNSKNINYKINEGDGAFYGPKIDFHLKDSLGRTWQCGTIQLDFQMPNNFGLKYVDKDGKQKTPVMIHHVLFGSIERFMGMLTEHYNAKFPLWLSPEQIRILPISEKHYSYADEINNILRNENLRSTVSKKMETIGKKVKESFLNNIPYCMIIGDKELEESTITLKNNRNNTQKTTNLSDIVTNLKKDIANKETTFNL